MKKLFVISVLTLLLSSCGNLSSKMMGGTESNLISYIEMTEECPKDKIVIKDKQKAGGLFNYIVDVCGKEKMYKQVGGSITEIERD